MKVVLFVLVPVLFLTEDLFAQARSSSARAAQDAGLAERPSITLPCRGDDPGSPATEIGEAVQPIIQNGHSGAITTMAFSPRSTLLATGSQDGTVKLWSVRSGQLVRSLFVSGYWVYSVAFSPNGCMLAAGSGDLKIYRWNLDTNAQLPPLEAHAGEEDAVAISADGNLLPSETSAVGANARVPQQKSGDITALSADGAWTAISSGPEIILRSNSGGSERRLSSSQALGVSAVHFSESGGLLAVGLRDGQLSIWDKPSRATYRSLQPSEDGFGQSIRTVAFNPASNTVFGASRTGGVVRWDLKSPQPPKLIRAPAQGVRVDSSLDTRKKLGRTQPQPPRAFQISVDGVPQNPGTEETLVTAVAPSGTIAAGGLYFDPTITIGYVSLTKAGANRPAPRFTDAARGTDDVTALAFSSDGSRLAVGFSSGGIDILNVLDQSIIARLDGHRASINAIAFSPNGELLASGSVDKTVGLWDPKAGGPGRILAGHESPVLCVSLSGEDDGLLASGGADNKILLWNTKSGTLAKTLEGHTSAVNALAFVQGRKTLVSGGEDATLRFWDTSTFRLLATLLPVSGSPDWLTTTPSGFFDGKEGTWTQVLWQFNRDLFDVSPVEIGFRDYFVPNLLAKALGGQVPAAPRSLATLNRVQPIVRVVSVTPDSPGTVQVNVEVESATSKTHIDETGHAQQSGVYDLRVFRNRQLTVRWPDVAEGASPSSDQGLEAWRRLHSVPLQPDGKAVVSFHHVRVPQGGKIHKVDFTAYAFNSDRVKSMTSAPLEYRLPNAKAAPPRRVYLITLGVNANESHNLNLELAVSSAEQVRALLRGKLKVDDSEVIEIPLYSDLSADSNQVRSKTASKADVRAVLDLLAGRPADPKLRDEVDPKQQLRAAGPDDSVVFYVASHGYADPQGTFYLIPYDTGLNWGITEEVLTRCRTNPDQSTACKQAEDLLAHLISSADLASWWNGVDAGEMILILDTCHSGAAPGKQFRPAPLGDAGLGQLSYDKGMQILSASQPAQTEQGEWVTGGEGRTLLVDALETVAKANPAHTLEEWLRDAEEQLPVTARQLYPALKEEEVQLPILLDFARKGNISTIAAP